MENRRYILAEDAVVTINGEPAEFAGSYGGWGYKGYHFYFTVKCMHDAPVKHAAVAASCTTAGSKEYYSCSVCGRYFEDADCTKEIAADKLDDWKTVPATGHKAVKTNAVAATCTTAGSKEYYKCSACGRYYENADCTKEIAADKLDTWKAVPATGHAFDTKWTFDETNHWHSAVCAHTGEKKDTAAHTFGADNVCTACGYKKLIAHIHAGVKVEGNRNKKGRKTGT